MLPLNNNSRPALLIIDMQNFFFQQAERRRNLEAVVANINRLSAAFGDLNLPVYHVRSAFQPDGSDWDLKMKAGGKSELIEGSEEASFLPGINILPGHKTMTKTRYSAFFKTDLADILHQQGIDYVAVAGGYTHYCVNATIFDAYCHDFVPCLVTDGVISHLDNESLVLIERMRRNGYRLMTTTGLITKISDSSS